MPSPFTEKLFRLTFTTAGLYNLAFGIWAAIFPRAFFQLFNIPQPTYPQLWACLGMVVGVYGLLYLHAARNLNAAAPIIAVGLLGKILGPIGMFLSFSPDWPQRIGTLCLYNDLIWWLPFAAFLIRNTSLAKWLVPRTPLLCAITHAIALATLILILRHGGPVEPDLATRAQYITAHPTAWPLAWSTWMLAAASLIAFYAWWGAKLTENSPTPTTRTSTIPLLAVILAACGMVCDFSGEGIMILWLPERLAAPNPQFADLEHTFSLLCAGAANGLYTLAGALLTSVTRNLPRWILATLWTTWLAGAIMTVAAIADSILWISISSAILFPLLLVWTLWMAAKWSQNPAVNLAPTPAQ